MTVVLLLLTACSSGGQVMDVEGMSIGDHDYNDESKAIGCCKNRMLRKASI
ncbi:MAG: hypothetical protein ACSW8A_05605 [Lachnospiraceae bacterium]